MIWLKEKHFKNYQIFIKIIEINNKDKIIIGLIANKSDLYENQQIDIEEGKKYANDINAIFFENTAKEHECIENVFKEIIREYYKKILLLNLRLNLIQIL